MKAFLRRITSPIRWAAGAIQGVPRGIHRFFTEVPKDTPLTETVGTVL